VGRNAESPPVSHRAENRSQSVKKQFLTRDKKQGPTEAEGKEILPTHDGRWFTARIMPYRTLSNMIDGAVITFADITTAKTLEARLRETLAKQGGEEDAKGRR
jgi:PAS domain S-box-containing protein